MQRVPAAIAVAAAVAAAAAATAAPAAPRCSAAELSPAPVVQRLPAPVARMRERIVRAAVRCDYVALDRIGREGAGLAFSYGGERSAAAYWRRLEREGRDRPLEKLVKLLNLPWARNEGLYVWPSAHRERPSDRDWRLLRAVYPQKVIDAMRRGGSYLGYRIGITPGGDWLYFVAGD